MYTQSPLPPPPPPSVLPPPLDFQPPPPRRRGRRWVFIVAGLVGAFLALAVVGTVIEEQDAEERVNEYLIGVGEKEFFASDVQFRATFPTIPERSVESVDVAGITIPVTIYISELANGAYGVSAFDLGPDVDFDLNLAVNGAAAAMGGRVESSNLVDFKGFEAVECQISAPDNLTVQGLVIRTPQRAYMLQVVGDSESNALDAYDKFLQSFEIIV